MITHQAQGVNEIVISATEIADAAARIQKACAADDAMLETAPTAAQYAAATERWLRTAIAHILEDAAYYAVEPYGYNRLPAAFDEALNAVVSA